MWHKDKKWTNTVGKNGTNRCVWCRVVINLQFVKKKVHYMRRTIKWSAIKWGVPVQWNII